jgi:hypothetical protein
MESEKIWRKMGKDHPTPLVWYLPKGNKVTISREHNGRQARAVGWEVRREVVGQARRDAMLLLAWIPPTWMPCGVGTRENQRR